MSAFWKYFADSLRWPQIHAPGALQAFTRGLAGHLDATRDDALYLREQFFPAKAEDALLPVHGDSRGITRHLTETDTQFRDRVTHAYGWHLLGGKTLGLPEILKFYGWDGVRIENMRHEAPHRWAEFSIGLQTPQNNNYDDILATLSNFVWLINEYKPARSVLWRIYTDIFDRRPIVLANGPKLGEGWLSFYSGVSVPGLPDGDIIVSFGVRNGYQAHPYLANALAASFGTHTHIGFLAPYLDTFMVGRSALSDVFPRNNPFVIGSLFSILWADRARVGRSWRGQWDARSWLDYTGFDRQLPRWRMERRAISRAQLVPSFGEPLSDTNARLGATFAETFNNTARLGGFKLSAHDMERLSVRLHELFVQQHGAVTPQRLPDVSGHGRLIQSGVGAHRAAIAPYLDKFRLGRSSLSDVFPRNKAFVIDSLFSILWAEMDTVAHGWQGQWDARRWLEYINLDRKLPPWRMRARAQSRAQLVPSFGEPLASNNARLGATFAEIFSNPALLGGFKLSAHSMERLSVRLHEMIITPTGVIVPPLQPAPPQSCGHSHISVSPATPNPQRVQVGGHNELSLVGAFVERRLATAASLSLATCSAALINPLTPKPAAAVATIRAPVWQGAWQDKDRTWKSTQQLSIQ